MKDPSSKRFWQRMAKLYAPFMKRAAPLYDEITRRCLPYLHRDMDILELACGSEQLTFRLAAQVRRWEATDFSAQMVAEAKKHPAPPGLTYAVRDATALPYTDASFDGVMIANALHIMPEPGRALKEIHRVLKPGGMLMAPTLMTLAGFRVLHRWDTPALSDFVRQRGFTVIEQHTLGGSIRPLCCLIAQKNTEKR